MIERFCRKCGISNAKVTFCQGKNLCNPCKSGQVKEKRHQKGLDGFNGRPDRTVQIDEADYSKIELLLHGEQDAFSFSDRKKLNETLPVLLGKMVFYYDILQQINKARLSAAFKSKKSVEIKDAETALRNTTNSQSSFLQKIVENLKLLDDLRKKDEVEGREIIFQDGGEPPDSSVVSCAAPGEFDDE